MTPRWLTTLIDVGGTALALLLGLALLARRWRIPPAPTEREPFGPIELAVTGAGLLAAAVGPNVLVVALTPGMPAMHVLARWILLPSIALLGLAVFAGRATGARRVLQRVCVGAIAGAAASGALDAIRLGGFHLGLMPGNMPRMFGVLLLDRMALGPSPASDLVGSVYHYWNGACFGLAYVLVAGRGRWWWGLLWGLLIEVGMMTTSPMVVAMDTGYFGVKFGPGLLATSLPAHVAFGIGLGLLVERYVTDPATLPRLLAGYVRRKRLRGGDVAAPSRTP